MTYRRDIQPNPEIPEIETVTNQMFDLLESIDQRPEVKFLALCRMMASAIMDARSYKNVPIEDVLDMSIMSIVLQINEFVKKDAKDREQAS